MKNTGIRNRKVAAVPAPPMSTGRFVDLAVFVVAYEAYNNYLIETGSEATPHLKKGLSLLKRHHEDLITAIKQVFGPLAERPDSGSIRSPINLALRVSNPSEVGISHWSKSVREVLPWIKRHPTLFGDLFTGRAARAARELASIVEEESYASLLNKLATIAPVSGLTITRKWTEEAAAAAGVPLTPTENTLVDAQVARGLGEDLGKVENALTTVPTNTPEAAELQEKRADLIQQIGAVAQQSPNPDTILAVAAQAKPPTQYATETGKKQGLTPEQEDAMMARGRVIIAAGAGSGKTRVIASKVAYHVTELGLPVSAILATSFTIKASAELIKRCKDYGAVIPDKTDGFGTTHSIAGRLLNKYAPDFKRPNYLGKKEGWKQTTIFRLAMDQVKMKSPSSKDPPDPKGFWDDLMKGQSQSQGQGQSQPQLAPGTSPVAPPPPSSASTYTKAIDDTLSYFRWAANTWSGGPGGWAKEQIPFLQDMRNADPSQLTDRQKTWLNKLFEKVKGRTFVNYRVAAGRSQGVESPDTATESEDWRSQVVPEPKQRQNKMEEYTFHQQPANQWFNLGRELMIEDSKGNKKPIPMGEFRRAVSILKGKAISPSQAWAGEGGYEAGSDHAAVYAAYEWIKGNNGEPSFAGSGDMDDLLLDTVSALIGSPNLRQQIQSQYKVLLVDEAQDLNKIQHVLFGLMAGYLDPKTLAPWEDKHMTADTFSMIGDDFQAIYEFRGANPDEFINKSDLVEGEGDFKTKLLDTNFRSGEAIVQAANKLIAHNTKQIPKVCKANTERNGQGSIIARPCDSVEDAAETLAEEIEGTMESAMTDSAKYKNFGVAVRSNAEAYQYGVAMLKKGIPFKCNVQFFNDNNTKALIGWLTIAEKGLDGDPGLIEDAIRSAVKAPFSNLGTAFFSNLEEKARGSWARWLVDGGHSRIYSSGKWAGILQHFVSNIDTVAQFTGTPSELVNKILQLKGVDGTSMQEAMIRSVTENDDLMAELAAESESGRVSEEQILEMATAPVDPLIGLMKGKENLGSAMTYVRKLRDVNSKVASRDTEDELDRDAVTIGTMHSWKGLEIQTMYIPMIGGKFPRTGKDGYSSETPELASERRLAYVAITRAEQKAVILDIPHPKHGVHSQFISEACIPLAGTNLPDEEEVEEAENSVQKVASRWTDSAIDKLASRYLESEDE